MSRALRPLFVNVTWGAGGSTSSKSLELAEICQRQMGLTTCLHLTCTNMKKKMIDETLEEAKTLGIRNILALRGDPPRGDEYRMEGEEEGDESNKDFTWAIDLVRYIRKTHGHYFCIGVAAYPEGHADESYPTEQSPEHDLPYLIEKTKAGADFIMTQLFYQEGAYHKFETMLREHDSGVFKTIPIIPGLMPIQSYQILKRTSKLSHAKLPPELLDKLEPIKGDDEAVKVAGVEIISEIIEELKLLPSPGPRGFHFYTLNLEKAVGLILERCELIPAPPPLLNGHVFQADTTPNGATASITIQHPHPRRPSTTTSSNHLTTSPRSLSPTRPTLSTPHPTIPLSREATWDDYPNGRFGDARSPAFGEIDGYGPTLHVTPNTARRLWGSPTSRSDITTLFLSHLSGTLEQMPWSEGELNAETELIKSDLSSLCKRNYWTIASQPAVDGASSSHPVLGWGPPGGFVFQKSFVEFFVPISEWYSTLLPYLKSPATAPEISYYATSSTGKYESSESAEAVNAVTWGSFPGKEIVTPTIIEEVSFRAWGEEAFGIWAEWGRVLGRGEAGRCVRSVGEESMLVNVICHGYREERRLWEILMAS